MIAETEFFFWLAQPIDCRAVTSFWPAQSINCHAVIFLLAGAIHQLLHFSFGQRDTLIAAPRFFFASARSVDCCAAIFSFGPCDPSIAAPQFFQLAGAIPRLLFDCCFLTLMPVAAIVPDQPWRHNQPCASHSARSSCLALTIRRDPQALRQPFGVILSLAPAIRRNTQASRQPLAQYPASGQPLYAISKHRAG